MKAAIGEDPTVGEVASAIRLLGPAHVEAGGLEFPLPPASDPAQSVHHLVQFLYPHVYSRSIRRVGDPFPVPGRQDDLAEALASASRTRERWDDGWHVESRDPNGGAWIRRGRSRRWASPGTWRASYARTSEPTVQVLVARASRTEQPGFVHFAGETLPDGDETLGLLRFYWNVSADGAPTLAARLTGTLNRFRVPFRLKCLESRSAYYRSDSAVLYIKRGQFQPVIRMLGDVHAAVAAEIEDDVPLFTRRLAPGLGLAMDPDTGESFGMHRCAILARGLHHAWATGAHEAKERTEAVVARFRAERIDVDRPYLNPGDRDIYELPPDWP